jgi:hypothetical protein
MSSTPGSSEDGWTFREDFCAAGGKAIPFDGRDETLWLIRVEWPTPNAMGRLIIREYEHAWRHPLSGEMVEHAITVERGRVWMPQADGDDGEDGA